MALKTARENGADRSPETMVEPLRAAAYMGSFGVNTQVSRETPQEANEPLK
jgi:hypothetical protein